MYEKLVFEFPEEHNEIAADEVGTSFVANPQAYFRGASEIPGAVFNQSYQIVVKPYFLDKIPHRHHEDEYLIFLGASFPNVFDFDAEIEFTLGQEGVDAEKFVITKPTIVRIPKMVYHCPLNFKRVDKPILFLATLMEPMFSVVADTPEGPKAFYYNGPGQCKYNDKKKCDACGKCLQEGWEPL